MNILRERTSRLERLGVVIQTEYHDRDGLKIRRSDGSVLDDVAGGVVLDKKYYLGQRLKHQETEFNPGVLYSFVFHEYEGGRVVCPNCGGVGKADLFTEGCPFCGSYYNLEYESKDLGSRAHADYVRYGKRSALPILLSIVLCAAAALLITLLSGRTLRPMDAAKGLVVAVLVGAAVGLFWNYRKSRSEITPEDREKKSRQESMLRTMRDRLAAAGSSLSEYTNALVAELETRFFGGAPETADVVDFDVLDYLEHAAADDSPEQACFETEVLLRVIRCRKGEIRPEKSVYRVCLRKNAAAAAPLRPGANFRSCPNCGASLDLTETRCGYCGAPLAYVKPFTAERIQAAGDA